MERGFFLKNTLTGTATLRTFSFVLGGIPEIFGKKAPGNKIKVSLTGCRNQGWSDLNVFPQFPEIECVSLCDIDDEWLNQHVSDVENAR